MSDSKTKQEDQTAEDQTVEEQQAQESAQQDADDQVEADNEDAADAAEEAGVEEIAEDIISEDGMTRSPDGTVRHAEGKVVWAPPGSHNAAMAGVQQDAAGHVDSVGSINSDKSGTRI